VCKIVRIKHDNIKLLQAIMMDGWMNVSFKLSVTAHDIIYDGLCSNSFNAIGIFFGTELIIF